MTQIRDRAEAHADGIGALLGNIDDSTSRMDVRGMSSVDPNDAASIAGLMINTEGMVAEAPKKESAGGGGGHDHGGGGGMGGMDF